MKFTKEITQTLQKVASLIKKSKNIVLMPHAKMDCDGMSASVALHLILNKFGKHSTTVCSDPVPEAFAFLPSSDIFSQEITAKNTKIKQFHLRVDNSDKKFKNLEYSVEDGKINIILFSEDTPFNEADFTFLGAQLKPDLIITLDSGDTDQLGKMYKDNTELFAEVPVINIDHHFSNTQFGDVNLVDYTSSSTTQLIYNLIPFLEKECTSEESTQSEEKIEKKQILDANIATLLLAGMLTDTGSFQHANTTPEALDIASVLIENGAEHQKIVKHLFKTKSVQTLKIWGRVLMKLQQDTTYKIVWSQVSRNDLEETGAHSDDINDLIDELMATTPDTELVLLVKEREDDIISTSVRSSSDDVDSVAFTSIFGGGGHKQAAGFKIRERGGKSFEEIVSDIVYEAKLFQAKRLHIPLPKRGLLDIINSEKIVAVPIETESIENIVAPLMPDFPAELENITKQKNSNPVQITETAEVIEIPKIVQAEVKTETLQPVPVPVPVPEIITQEKQTISTEKVNTDLFGDPITENISELSEEEIPYAEHKESFEMPAPEKYIEKPEDEGNYDDFADFLAKADENEDVEYLTETQTADIDKPSLNPYVASKEPAEPEIISDPFLESLDK